jgi:hypothetical protein
MYINDIPQLTQGRLIMHADDTSILTIGQDINELQNETAKNIGVVEQYFTMNKLPINLLKTHYILFHTKHYRLDSNLKILVKNKEIQNVRSTNFLGVVIDSTLSWEAHIETACRKVSCNLLIINKLSKILDQHGRKMLYYGLIYPFLSYSIIVWEHCAKARIKIIFTLQKMAVRYIARFEPLESCRDSFRQLKILMLYSLYIQKIILCVKEKSNCIVNKQLHAYDTRNNNDYHKYVHGMDLYNSKPSVAGCRFYNKLPKKHKTSGQ